MTPKTRAHLEAVHSALNDWRVMLAMATAETTFAISAAYLGHWITAGLFAVPAAFDVIRLIRAHGARWR